MGLGVLPGAPAAADTVTLSRKVPATIAEAMSTGYAAPSGALYVATTGSDAADGTQAAPFATLAKAMRSVKANGTIVVRGGVYHQGAGPAVNPSTGGTYYFSGIPTGVTIQAAPGETVWFDGTQQVTNWKKVSKNHYAVSWETPDFCGRSYYSRPPARQASNGPCSYPDSIGGTASLGDPQMAFRDGRQLAQVSSLKKMTSASKFYYDFARRTLHIRFNPAGSTVELSRFAQAMALYRPTDFAIKGIGFRRYATNQVHNATAGAVLLNLGSDVLLENTVFTENAGGGLQGWQTTNLTVRQSILSGNGANGLNYDGNWDARGEGTSPADNLVIEYSRLDGNNTDRYGVNCTWACMAAGAKVTGTSGITLRYSSFSRNTGGRGSGFWCDLGCSRMQAYGNVFADNARHGLIYEISDGAVIASNLFVGNGWHSPAYGGGWAMYIGSAHVRMYNNTMVDNQQGVAIYDDSRSSVANTGGYAATRIGPSTVGIEFANNIISGGRTSGGRQLAISGADARIAGNTEASQMIDLVANNSYYRPANGPQYWVVWTERPGAKSVPFKTVAEAQASKGIETGSEMSRAASNPFLAAPGAGDYSVKQASSASGTAGALPEDIADLLGVPAGGHSRGVITLQG
jgi:hypothetical protein